MPIDYNYITNFRRRTRVSDRGRIATIVGFGRAAELGIAALSGADGGDEIRAAARPELIRLADHPSESCP